METQLQPILIPKIAKAPDKTQIYPVREYLPDLETLMPVQGNLSVRHKGNYLEITARVETIVTLTCDRCLQQYNHRLTVDTSELIWLEAPPTEVIIELGEQEIPYDELLESLPPQGFFDPAAWLYEQLCLAHPQRNLCQTDCPGISINTSATPDSSSVETIDQRWASLAQLKHQI